MTEEIVTRSNIDFIVMVCWMRQQQLRCEIKWEYQKITYTSSRLEKRANNEIL